MASKVKRTYGSHSNKLKIPSSPISTLSSSPPPISTRKRSLGSDSSLTGRPNKRLKSSKEKAKPKQKTLTQLHFCIDQTVVRTCSICNLSYTKGAPDDETLHRTHCARVRKGMEWGLDEERDKDKAGAVEIATNIKLKDGKKGRIMCMKADACGKIGSKLSSLLGTINLVLSAPALSPSALQNSKVYLFLLPSIVSTRENIAGCVVAQRIESAMAVANSSSLDDSTFPEPHNVRTDLISIDDSTGLFCYPEPLPTSLGISRIFVPSAHRRQGIATELLSVVASTFIHGCALDPKEGQIAFSQTTGDGMALMRSWGQGGIRIYDEDQAC